VHFVLPVDLGLARGPGEDAWPRARTMCCASSPSSPGCSRRTACAATYVGIRSADAIPLEVPAARGARQALGLSPADGRWWRCCPAAAAREIAAIAPRMLQAAALLAARSPTCAFVLPCAPAHGRCCEPLPCRARAAWACGLVQERSHAALAACDVALVASGTATLETALFQQADGDRLPHAPA
jgi:lipid-A-disaccharide synthase